MSEQISDEDFIEKEFEKVQTHIKENFPYKVKHVGKFGDELCCKEEVEKDHECWVMINTYGLDKLYYAFFDEGKYKGVLVNLEFEEPISQPYTF